MAIQYATAETFDSLVAQDFVIVDFFSDHCGPCKVFSKVLEDTAAAHYWKKLSYEALCRTRQGILHTTTAQVAGYAARMQEAAARGAICVLGPRRQLEACGDELDTILSI